MSFDGDNGQDAFEIEVGRAQGTDEQQQGEAVGGFVGGDGALCPENEGR